jgi:tyrosyl-tRNA synthetase
VWGAKTVPGGFDSHALPPFFCIFSDTYLHFQPQFSFTRPLRFWFNTADADAVKFLKFFTFPSREEIDYLAQATTAAAHERRAQCTLDSKTTRMVHGAPGLSQARKARGALFVGSLDELSSHEIFEIFSDIPSSKISREALATAIDLPALLAGTGLVQGKSDARRQIMNRRVTNLAFHVVPTVAIKGRFLVIKKGSSLFHVGKSKSSLPAMR